MSKVIVDGVEWQEFLIEFQTQEGTFNFKLFAVDWAHAIDRLEELKATAKVVGDNCSEVPAAPVQEPVAYRSRLASGSYTYCNTPQFFDNAEPLYTTPPPAPVQEPVAAQCRFPAVAWAQCDVEHARMVMANPHEWKGYEVRLLYTTPPAAQRQWVGLTDEQIESLWDHGMYVHCSGITALRAITRAIEAKLKEKNT